MPTAVASYTKDPDSTLDYVLSWLSWLSTGDTIVSSTWEITPAGELVEADGLPPDATGSTTRIWLSGGQPATVYTVSNTVVTADGLTDTQFFYVQVEEVAGFEPDIDTGYLCDVTGRFFTAGGDGVEGVFVRFTPTRETDRFGAFGLVVREQTAVSDSTGHVRLNLVRGVSGTLSITGLGIVREITVPDVGAIPLQALVELGDDPLEVQRPVFTQLPRRS